MHSMPEWGPDLSAPWLQSDSAALWQQHQMQEIERRHHGLALCRRSSWRYAAGLDPSSQWTGRTAEVAGHDALHISSCSVKAAVRLLQAPWPPKQLAEHPLTELASIEAQLWTGLG